MEQIEINAGDTRYLSELKEFKDGIPFGIINKSKTDVGGTYCAINCNHNYIIVCPFKDLVDSIVADKNNKYNVFKCYGGIRENDFRNYLNENKICKIAVTYDSLPKLVRWIDNIKDYWILVDEYQIILEDMDFRYDAINNLMEEIKKFDHYSFLSATPIDINYEIDFFKNLPHYKVIWNNCFKVNTIRYKTPYAAKALVRFIQIFMKEGIKIKDINCDFTDVNQLYIFINSVKSIKQVLDTLKLNPDQVKICCADRNRNRLILDEYKIESVCNPNKKINFFTKKCFQGCNLFTNNGLIIVVSDGRLDHTLVDISTSMEQIVGRIRTNSEYQNVFRHLLVHIFSTNNNILSDNEFNSLMKDKEVEANNLLSVQNKVTNDELIAIISRLDIENDILSIINGKLIYNELKRQSFIYKQELKKAYKNGISIRAKFSKSEKFVVHNQEEWTDLDIKLSKAVTISYQQLLKDYLDHPDSSYELEYPEFLLIKEHLTESEMNSLRWNKDKMIKAVNDKKIIDKIYMDIFKTGFISNKDLKTKFKLEFEKYNITLSPKASLIEDCRLYDVRKCQKRIDETKVSGYELSNLYIKL